MVILFTNSNVESFAHCRSALGNSSPLLKTRPCATWEDNEAPNAIQDDGISDGSSKGHCTPESKSKDSCSSVCPSALTLNMQGCFTSPEMPAMVKTDHQNFLTLGLSSYPGSPQLEGEVNSEETMNMEDVHRIKGLDVFHEEEDDNLQLQMCNPQQVHLTRSCIIWTKAGHGWGFSCLVLKSFEGYWADVSGFMRMSKLGVLPVRNMREIRMLRVCATAMVKMNYCVWCSIVALLQLGQWIVLKWATWWFPKLNNMDSPTENMIAQPQMITYV